MKRTLLLALLAATIIAAGSAAQEPLRLKVASYNLRMDTPADSGNAWTYRKEEIKALVSYHEFDFIGTQEGFIHQLQGILELPEYTFFGAGRDDGKEAGEHSAIIYKKNRFTIIESGNFWLSETPDKPGKGWDATCCNRICSWAKFKENQSGETFYFFNVHFDHQGVVARRESGKLMVQKMKEIAKDAKVICTGDFNSTPETEQIRLISSWLNDSRTVSQLPPYGPEGTFNRRFANPIGPSRIDYIFVSPGIRVLKQAHITDNNGSYYPSDHIPAVANIILK
jgi:endonuclease/exonuclease/phosphatase family metal-dependent hydrolase